MKCTPPLVPLLASVSLMSAWAQTPHGHSPHAAHTTNPDTRQLVKFPPRLERNTLATMRKHLQGLAEVQQALAERHFDQAAQVATMTLGMSSMRGDQADEEAKYMPPDMKKLGMQLHQRAEEFALAAQEAAVTGDTHKPLLLLSRMMQTCVACHATYRLR